MPWSAMICQCDWPRIYMCVCAGLDICLAVSCIQGLYSDYSDSPDILTFQYSEWCRMFSMCTDGVSVMPVGLNTASLLSIWVSCDSTRCTASDCLVRGGAHCDRVFKLTQVRFSPSESPHIYSSHGKWSPYSFLGLCSDEWIQIQIQINFIR